MATSDQRRHRHGRTISHRHSSLRGGGIGQSGTRSILEEIRGMASGVVPATAGPIGPSSRIIPKLPVPGAHSGVAAVGGRSAGAVVARLRRTGGGAATASAHRGPADFGTVSAGAHDWWPAVGGGVERAGAVRRVGRADHPVSPPCGARSLSGRCRPLTPARAGFPGGVARERRPGLRATTATRPSLDSRSLARRRRPG